MIPQAETRADITLRRPTIDEKAKRLFELGYRAELGGGSLMVVNPDGRQYRVDPRAGTCSCPATVTCSHLLGWYDLAIETANALCWAATEISAAADAATERGPGRAYTARGLELRAQSVRVCDRSSKLAMWAYAAQEGRAS